MMKMTMDKIVQKITQVSQFLLILVLFAGTCACRQDSFDDLTDYLAQMKQQQLKLQPPVKFKINVPKPVTYQANRERSPFVRPEAVASKQEVETNPLLAYPLSMLRLAGTIVENGIVQAYIITPDGMLYQVKVGDTIGDRRGKVTSIQGDRLDVMQEESEDGKPGVQRKVTLQIKGIT